MTSMPELVAAFHSLVGMAAVLVAAGAFYAPEAFDIGKPGAIHASSLVEMSLGVAIGALTFTGSVIAFLKLSARMSGAPIILPFRHAINIALAAALVFFVVGLVISGSALDFWLITIIALVLGVLMIIPIGGADMPVVISMLNSYSGWSAAGIGFTLGNTALIVTGALVGSSGAILSYIMCHAMNRSFISVILGGFGGETAAAGAGGGEVRPVKLGSADDDQQVVAEHKAGGRRGPARVAVEHRHHHRHVGAADGHDHVHAEQQRDHGHHQQRQHAVLDVVGVEELAAEPDDDQQARQVEPVAARQQQRLAADLARQLAEGDDRAGEGDGADEDADVDLHLVNGLFGTAELH
jgi:hypothetical protein